MAKKIMMITSDMVRVQTEQLQKLTGMRYYICSEDNGKHVITQEFDTGYKVIRGDLTLAEAYNALVVANYMLLVNGQKEIEA